MVLIGSLCRCINIRPVETPQAERFVYQVCPVLRDFFPFIKCWKSFFFFICQYPPGFLSSGGMWHVLRAA